MIRTIVNGSFHTEYRESRKNTCLGSLLDTFADRRDIFLRNRSADHFGLELKQLLCVRIHRLKAYFTMTVLSAAAGLLRILVFLVYCLCERLFVGNLRCAYIRLNLELAEQTVYDNLQMELAHTCDNRLSRLRVRVCVEGRIFLRKLRKSLAHLALTGLGLRLNRKFNNRIRELHGLEDDRMLLIADRIACRRKLKADSRSNISGINLIKFLSLVRVHLQNTSHTLFLALCRIQHIGTGIHGSGVNTEKRKFSNERVCHDLECESGERLFIRRMSLNLIAVQIRSLDRRDVGRSRHILHNRIEHLLNTLVAVSGTAAYRNSGTLTGSLAQYCF